MKLLRSLFLLLASLTVLHSYSQDSVIISASNKYEDPSLIKIVLIGKNYRDIWSTPVKMKMLDITTEKGGLKPTELGGGFQTKSLRMKEKNGREWVLRTVDKDVTKAVPAWLRKTFAQTLVQDMISSAYPYAPLTVAHLAKAIRVNAPDPELVFVPDDPAFKEYRKVFANTICMLELSNPTPDDSDTKNTDALYEKLKESSENIVDDTTLLKARLLDMLIADWDRHADQWKWGIKKEGGKNIYYPIPRDRDQAFFLSKGLLVKVVRLFTLKHFVGFTDNLEKLNKLNGKSWEFDHLLLNRLTEADWIRIIKSFQQTLDDRMLTEAVMKMPKEVVQLNGNIILEKLKKRRDDLMKYGMKYYELISKEVKIYATEASDVARVTMNGEELVVSLQHTGSQLPYYSRSFNAKDTKKISLHLFDGSDEFIVENNVSSPILFSLDSGKGKDRFSINGKLRLHTDKDTEKKIAEDQLAGK
jgi:hypothetical protein